MRMRLRTAATIGIVGALMAGTITPAAAETTPRPDALTTWAPDLAAGETAGVRLDDGTARLDLPSTFMAPVDDGLPGDGPAGGAGNSGADGAVDGAVDNTEGGPAVPTGLLTLPPRQLAAPTDRVDVTVTGDIPPGTTASLDVRGLRDTGSWTEWIPAAPGPDGMTTQLPAPASEVQGRLVLTAAPGIAATAPTTGSTTGSTTAAGPVVDGVTLTAHPVDRSMTEGKAATEQAALTYRVFATREGLVGGTTANGHVIADRDHFVALPSRRALSPRNTSDYSVKVCAPNGLCAFAPVWDVGPWNTKDDYWNPAPQRQQWGDLPQGTPQAQAAYQNGYNGGNDGYNRKVLNPAGIDLGDGLFWDALGLKNNAWVTVDYLWTGSTPLAKVASVTPVTVRSAPDGNAEAVGVAADKASVPVECTLTSALGTWLRIGVAQYIDAAAVPALGRVATCTPDAPAPAP